jgi:hypothetical protein
VDSPIPEDALVAPMVFLKALEGLKEVRERRVGEEEEEKGRRGRVERERREAVEALERAAEEIKREESITLRWKKEKGRGRREETAIHRTGDKSEGSLRVFEGGRAAAGSRSGL